VSNCADDIVSADTQSPRDSFPPTPPPPSTTLPPPPPSSVLLPLIEEVCCLSVRFCCLCVAAHLARSANLPTDLYILLVFIGPIPWGHSGPLCHAFSLSSLWTSHAACAIALLVFFNLRTIISGSLDRFLHFFTK